MKNRVRYGKVDENGIKTSVSKLFNRDGVELKVELDTFSNIFKIVNWPEGFTLDDGQASSYQLMLRAVKLRLIDLGVGLTTESRNRDGIVVHGGKYVEGNEELVVPAVNE